MLQLYSCWQRTPGNMYKITDLKEEVDVLRVPRILHGQLVCDAVFLNYIISNICRQTYWRLHKHCAANSAMKDVVISKEISLKQTKKKIQRGSKPPDVLGIRLDCTLFCRNS